MRERQAGYVLRAAPNVASNSLVLSRLAEASTVESCEYDGVGTIRSRDCFLML
jgi:hypothetical protein